MMARMETICARVAVLAVALMMMAGTTAHGWDDRAKALYDSMMSVADEIIARDAPTDAQGPEMIAGGEAWLAGWESGETRVAGIAREEGGTYRAFCIETTDAALSFYGGVRVGGDVGSLEGHLGVPLDQLGPEGDGTIDLWEDEEVEMGPYVRIGYEGGKIVSLAAEDVLP